MIFFRRLFISLIILLFVSVVFVFSLAAFRFATPPFATQKSSEPEGLIKNNFIPEGTQIESGTNNLRITITRPKPDQTDSIAFSVILPPSASLTPKITDYRLTLKASPAPNKKLGELKSKSVFTPADAASQNSYSPVSELQSMIHPHDEGIVRFYRLAKITIDPRVIAIPKRGEHLVEKIAFDFPFAKPVQQPSSRPLRDWGFDRILKHLVANPEAVSLYENRSQGEPNTAPLISNRASLAANNPNPQSKIHIPQSSSGDWFRMDIAREGLYRVGMDHLTSAGLRPDSINPETIRIYSRGKEVPSFVIGPRGGQFTESNAVIFYGTGSDSPYSVLRAYWINVDAKTAAKPLRIATLEKNLSYQPGGNPHITTLQERILEEDKYTTVLHGNFLSIKDNAWVWQEIHPRNQTPFAFDLPDLDPRATTTLSLGIRFYLLPSESGAGMPTHDIPPLRVRINNTLTTTIASFTSKDDALREFTFDSSHVRESGNVLSLQFERPYPPSEEQYRIYLDSFSIRYWRGMIARGGQLQIETQGGDPWHKMTGFLGEYPLLFDLTNPEAPSLLSVESLSNDAMAFYEARAGRKLLAIAPSSVQSAPRPKPASPSNLSSPGNSADYLVIYHPMFTSEIQPLVDLHTKQGMRVRTVPIDEVFQNYSFGESTPHAIKGFLYDALRRWAIPPTYVCIFGDASSDYRNKLNSGVANLIPAYSYDAQGEEKWASELWYATLLGADLLPDIALGRISVRTKEDAREVVRKIVDYTNQPPMGPWRSRIGFCADDSGFREATETLYRDYSPKALGNERIYLEEFPFEDNFYLAKDMVAAKDLKVSTAATVKLSETYNRGIALMAYFGHGSPNIWTDERIWFGGDSPNSDNLNLQNGARLPFITTFTCNHGAFDYPMPQWHVCISEDIMRVKNGGAIGLFVPSGPGVTPTHEKVAQAFFQSLFRENLRRIGEATALTTLYYLLENGPPEMIRMFVLLGDPALDLAIPQPTGQGTVRPASISRAEVVGAKKITFQGETPGMWFGKFVGILYDTEDKAVLQTKPASFYGGKVKWEFSLPENAQEGRWTARVYYGNNWSHKDGCLSAQIQVTRPTVQIASFRFENPATKAGQKTAVLLKLENKSSLPAAGIPIQILHQSDKAKTATLLDDTLNLEPGSSQVFKKDWVTQSGVHRFVCNLGRYTLPSSDETTPHSTPPLVAHIPTNPAVSISTLPSMAKTEWQSYATATRFSLTIPIFYSSIKGPLTCQAQLLDKKGAVLAATNAVFGAQGHSNGETNVIFSLALAKAELEKQYRLIVKKDETSAPLLEAEIPLGAPNMPDLAIRPGSIQFTPAKPVEGETIFARALIENRGNAPAPAFRLQVSSLNVEEKYGDGTVLYSKPDLSQMEQRPLAPGRSRWTNLRWDYPAYKEYAGLSTIRLRVDSSDQIAELDETNNVQDTRLRIFKRPEVKDIEVEKKLTHRTDTLKRIEIRVKIKNLGEVTAANRHLGFFNYVPIDRRDLTNPKVLVKDIALPAMQGGQVLEFYHKWDADFSNPLTSPTVKVYQPTQSLRSATEGPIEPEW